VGMFLEQPEGLAHSEKSVGMCIFRTFVIALFAVALASVFVACGSDEESTVSDTALPDVRLATVQGYELLPLAIEQSQEQLAQRGIVLEITVHPSEGEAIQALAAGQADGLVTSMDAVISLFNTEYPVLVATTVRDNPEMVLAFSEHFLLGNTASGEDVLPETSAEAVSNILSAWNRTVEQINVNLESDEFVHSAGTLLGLESGQDIPAIILSEFPHTGLPDRSYWEPRLAQMYASGGLDIPIAYDSLMFVPGLP